jgi:hypothetical protein
LLQLELVQQVVEGGDLVLDEKEEAEEDRSEAEGPTAKKTRVRSRL